MSKTKYIVYDTPLNEEIIIFGGTQQHSEVANRLGVKPISAGFININVEKDEYGSEVPTAHAFGDSVSLNLKSREDVDSRLANRALSLGKYY